MVGEYCQRIFDDLLYTFFKDPGSDKQPSKLDIPAYQGLRFKTTQVY